MDLVAAFEELGVSNPEMWAKSQSEEGIDQLARATILRAFADAVNDAPAIWEYLASDPSAPEKLRASAAILADLEVPKDDLERALKATLSDVMFRVLALLDGAGEPAINPGNIMFGAFPVDEKGDDFVPRNESLALHESWNEIASNVLGEDVVRA